MLVFSNLISLLGYSDCSSSFETFSIRHKTLYNFTTFYSSIKRVLKVCVLPN